MLEEVAAHCFYVSHGWWSYELCPGHHVGQFHSIEGERRIESVLSLGRYDAVQVPYIHPVRILIGQGVHVLILMFTIEPPGMSNSGNA